MDLQGVVWRKSTRSSGGGNNDCVEVADAGDVIAVRDSKDREGPTLTFSPNAWNAFIDGSKRDSARQR